MRNCSFNHNTVPYFHNITTVAILPYCVIIICANLSMPFQSADITQIILFTATFIQLLKSYTHRFRSSPIAVALEVKPQLEDVVVKLTAKAPLI